MNGKIQQLGNGKDSEYMFQNRILWSYFQSKHLPSQYLFPFSFFVGLFQLFSSSEIIASRSEVGFIFDPFQESIHRS